MQFSTFALSALSIGSVFGRSTLGTSLATDIQRHTDIFLSSKRLLHILRSNSSSNRYQRCGYGPRRQGRLSKWHISILPQQHRRCKGRYGSVPVRTRQPHRHPVHIRSAMPAYFSPHQHHRLLLWVHACGSKLDKHTHLHHHD